MMHDQQQLMLRGSRLDDESAEKAQQAVKVVALSTRVSFKVMWESGIKA